MLGFDNCSVAERGPANTSLKLWRRGLSASFLSLLDVRGGSQESLSSHHAQGGSTCSFGGWVQSEDGCFALRITDRIDGNTQRPNRQEQMDRRGAWSQRRTGACWATGAQTCVSEDSDDE